MLQMIRLRLHALFLQLVPLCSFNNHPPLNDHFLRRIGCLWTNLTACLLSTGIKDVTNHTHAKSPFLHLIPNNFLEGWSRLQVRGGSIEASPVFEVARPSINLISFPPTLSSTVLAFKQQTARPTSSNTVDIIQLQNKQILTCCNLENTNQL